MADRPPPAPAGLQLRADADTRVAGDARVLLGGSPLRVFRLTAPGARVVARWFAGSAVGDGAAERGLARRLLDAGLAHPDPPADADPRSVTIVVPVHGRPEELRRCVAALDRRCPLIVVDDGSPEPDRIAAVAGDAGAELIRLEASRGPSAARNAGLRRVRTPFVAFVDSDCVVGDPFPGQLLGHLADPAVAAAAPRIVALRPAAPGMLARYETERSALDMGPREGLARPGSAIPYVPSAALVARVVALGAGFDEALQTGEDVDLVWRLHDAGWQVRYDPSATVAHDHRVGLRPWFRRRVTYNASTATLLRRHPGRVPALSVSRSAAAFWAALACGSPATAAAIGLATGGALSGRLRPLVPGAPGLAARLIVRSRLVEVRHIGRALTGPWLPLLLAASVLRPRAARRAWLAVAAGAAVERSETPRPLAPRALEDFARCIGVWLGCLRERRFGALLPQVRRG